MQWKIANSKYKDVQSAILSGKQFELYADGKRLIPDDIRPVADKKELTIEPFDPEHMGLGRKSVATGRRKKNEKDNLDLFETGFQKASGLKLDKKPIKAEAGHKKEVPSFSEPVVVLEGDGTLSEWEQALLDRNYSVSPSVSNARSSTLRSHSLPRTVPSVIPSSKRMLGTSARTAALFRAMQAGQQLCADSETNKAWEIETYSAFKSSNVRWWPEERVGTGRDKSFRILGSCDFTPTEALADGFSTGSRGATFAATASEAHALKALANDSSEDDLPDIALLSSKASMAHSMPRSSLALPEPTFSPPRLPSAMSSLPSGARGQRQAGPRSHMAHIKSANGNNTIITIDDSDTEVAAMEKDPKLNASKGSPKNIIENVASHAKPAPQASPEVVSIGDSFDEDLDSSLWLAVDLASVAPKAAAMSSAGEQVRPGSPQLQSIVSVSSDPVTCLYPRTADIVITEPRSSCLRSTERSVCHAVGRLPDCRAQA